MIRHLIKMVVSSLFLFGLFQSKRSNSPLMFSTSVKMGSNIVFFFFFDCMFALVRYIGQTLWRTHILKQETQNEKKKKRNISMVAKKL